METRINGSLLSTRQLGERSSASSLVLCDLMVSRISMVSLRLTDRRTDPNELMALLQVYPWHVDTLLQMSEVYRLQSGRLLRLSVEGYELRVVAQT